MGATLAGLQRRSHQEDLPEMATIKKAITLKHQANLGEEPEDVAFSEGDEVTVLNEWEDYFLCKNEDGMYFNIPKTQLDS
jgi:hypothetical protein